MYIWSDGWCIEQDKVWFVSAMQNILFCINLKMNKYECTVGIPDENLQKFRLNPRCIKYGSSIYCMPDKGSSIWVYDVNCGRFSEIRIENPEKVRLMVYLSFIDNNKIYAISYGLGCIMEINPEKKKIINYYELGSEELIPDSVRVGVEVYNLSEYGRVYCFNMSTKKTASYALPDIGRKFFCLCFDGKNFWMGGYRKEVYVWDKEKNALTILDSFPAEFGLYNFEYNSDGRADCIVNEYNDPTFAYVIMAGEYIWFIPFLTNKIIYVNKNNYVLCAFEIEEENETRQSIVQNELKQKYVLEYVIDNRYIGLFSAKNRCILEIDAELLKYRWYDFELSDKYLRKCAVILGNTFREDYAFERKMYERMLLSSGQNLGSSTGRNIAGVNIYHEIMFDA